MTGPPGRQAAAALRKAHCRYREAIPNEVPPAACWLARVTLFDPVSRPMDTLNGRIGAMPAELKRRLDPTWRVRRRPAGRIPRVEEKAATGSGARERHLAGSAETIDPVHESMRRRDEEKTTISIAQW